MSLSGPVSSRPPRFSSAALATYGTQLGVAVVSFLSVLVVARALGPAGRGDVAFLTTIAVFSSTLGLFGIDEANANLAASEPGLRRALATNSLILSAVFGAACIGLVVALVEVFPVLGGEVDPNLRWLALAAIPVLILKVYLKFLIGADFRFGVTNVAWMLPPLASLVVNLALWIGGALSVTTAFATWAIAHLAATALLVWYVAHRLAGFGRPRLGVAGRSLRFGVKSHAGRMMMVGNYRFDQWFVGSAAGSRELGLYSIAVSLSEVLFYLPTALTIVQRPYLVRASRHEAVRRVTKVFRASVTVTAVFAGIVVLLAPYLCVWLFGSQFEGSVDDLRVLAIGAIGVVALKLMGSAMTAQRLPGLASIGPAVAFVITVALDAALVSAHGGLGAATAASVAYLAGGAVMVVLFARRLEAPMTAFVPRPAEVAALGGHLGEAFARARPSRHRRPEAPEGSPEAP